jgi:transposase-like protein
LWKVAAGEQSALVSRVTDAVMDDVAEWQQRPLEDWRESWEYVIPFLAFPPEVRRVRAL